VSSHQGCTNPVCQVTVATKFFMVAPRIFKWPLDLVENLCTPALQYMLAWLEYTGSKENFFKIEQMLVSSCTVYSWGVCKSFEFYRDTCHCILLEVYCSLFRFNTNSVKM